MKVINNPVESPIEDVLEEWIDYNGHMNVAYYTLAFDRAIDFFLEETLGIGPAYVRHANQGPYSLQANYHYLQELKKGDRFRSKVLIIGADKKKIHMVLEMINASNAEKVAICETLLINVDLTLRKSTEYPDWVQDKIQEYKNSCKGFALPREVGKTITLKK